MGGSSSKTTNNDKKKENIPFKGDENETMYREKKEQKEIINNNKINTNIKKIEDISNDIEELTLDKNGVLINEKDLTRSAGLPREKKQIINIPIIATNNISNIIKEKEETITLYTEKESQKIIVSFYDDFIEILYCYNSRKTFITLAKSLNDKYLYNFNAKKFPNTKECKAFLESFKYASIIIVCFIFLVKDYNLYENSAKKIRDNLEQFVFTCLDNIDRTVIFSLKIINFVQRYRKIKKSFFGCTSGIIRTLFKNKTSYKHILNCLEQILSNICTDSTKDITTKINESILFCYNASNIMSANSSKANKDNNEKNTNTNRTSKKKIGNTKSNIKNNNRVSNNKNNAVKIEKSNKGGNDKDNNNNDERNNSEAINAPYIKKELDKKFCLVLDIDETLSHMIKLPFGNYFLVRPGVMDLLKELYSYYEIDIFTAALKHYADNILNKLDKDNLYISYRLYRCHCTYEDGKSVKKLSLIGRDLNKIVFVDDLKRNAKYNMKNLALVSKWIDNIYDNEIITLKNKLKFIALCGKYDEDITKGLLEEKITENISS